MLGKKHILGKKSHFPLLIILLSAWTVYCCRPDEETFDNTYQNGLSFSTDTLTFDTLFTEVGSITKRIKVVNPNSKALDISQIFVGGGDLSPFDITVNGFTGTEFEHQTLLGSDSLLILVKVKIDPRNENLPYLIQDSIVLETNGIQQTIQLVAWGQDAHFLGNEVLPCNSVWHADRPYVLYNSILIDTLCQLTVDPGTRIFAAHDAYIYVKGSLAVNGTAENRVLFRNVRMEPRYDNAPGQWGGILFLEGSKNNTINFAVLRNAQFGVRLGTPDNDTIPDLTLSNTIIENMSESGILCFTSDLKATNVLVDHCVQFAAANLGGGNYRYENCTFSRDGINFINQNQAFLMTDNIPLDDQSIIVNDLKIDVINCIITGQSKDEILINNDGGAAIEILFAHNILQTSIDELNINDNLLNIDPKFIDPFGYDYRLDTLSPAIDAGLNINVLTDLDGHFRDPMPDIGAYERIE